MEPRQKDEEKSKEERVKGERKKLQRDTAAHIKEKQNDIERQKLWNGPQGDHPEQYENHSEELQL